MSTYFFTTIHICKDGKERRYFSKHYETIEEALTMFHKFRQKNDVKYGQLWKQKEDEKTHSDNFERIETFYNI